MTTTHRTPLLLLTALLVFALPVPQATAQKTQKAEKQKQVQTTPSTIRDFLVKHEGKATTLGTLTRVAGDFFVVEQEGVSSMHPLSSIHTFRLVKDEETGTDVLEILLLAKD